eukprot:9259383-Lingulodinium_polyedra.AAC.1
MGRFPAVFHRHREAARRAPLDHEGEAIKVRKGRQPVSWRDRPVRKCIIGRLPVARGYSSNSRLRPAVLRWRRARLWWPAGP